MHFAWTAQEIMENTDVLSLENSNKLNLQEPPIGKIAKLWSHVMRVHGKNVALVGKKNEMKLRSSASNSQYRESITAQR